MKVTNAQYDLVERMFREAHKSEEISLLERAVIYSVGLWMLGFLQVEE